MKQRSQPRSGIARCVGLAVAAALSACAYVEAFPDAVETTPHTSVEILVDTSASFAPLRQIDSAALMRIADSIVRLATHKWPTPVLIQWSTIGSSAMTVAPPCGGAIEYRPKLLSGDVGAGAGEGSHSGRIKDPEVLSGALNECLEAIVRRSRKPEPFTDISGSLAMAGETAKAVSGERFLIILSDFVEDHPKGVAPAHFVLHGERVLLVFRPQKSDVANPDQLFARLADWERRLKGAGAKAICRLPVQGVTQSNVNQCLDNQ